MYEKKNDVVKHTSRLKTFACCTLQNINKNDWKETEMFQRWKSFPTHFNAASLCCIPRSLTLQHMKSVPTVCDMSETPNVVTAISNVSTLKSKETVKINDSTKCIASDVTEEGSSHLFRRFSSSFTGSNKGEKQEQYEPHDTQNRVSSSVEWLEDETDMQEPSFPTRAKVKQHSFLSTSSSYSEGNSDHPPTVHGNLGKLNITNLQMLRLSKTTTNLREAERCEMQVSENVNEELDFFYECVHSFSTSCNVWLSCLLHSLEEEKRVTRDPFINNTQKDACMRKKLLSQQPFHASQDSLGRRCQSAFSMSTEMSNRRATQESCVIFKKNQPKMKMIIPFVERSLQKISDSMALMVNKCFQEVNMERKKYHKMEEKYLLQQEMLEDLEERLQQNESMVVTIRTLQNKLRNLQRQYQILQRHHEDINSTSFRENPFKTNDRHSETMTHKERTVVLQEKLLNTATNRRRVKQLSVTKTCATVEKEPTNVMDKAPWNHFESFLKATLMETFRNVFPLEELDSLIDYFCHAFTKHITCIPSRVWINLFQCWSCIHEIINISVSNEQSHHPKEIVEYSQRLPLEEKLQKSSNTTINTFPIVAREPLNLASRNTSDETCFNAFRKDLKTLLSEVLKSQNILTDEQFLSLHSKFDTGVVKKLLKESYNKRKQSYEKEELRHSMTLQKLPTTLLKRRQYIRRGNEYLLSTNTNLRKTSIQKRPTVEESLHDTTLQTFFNQTQEYILNYTNRFVPPWK